MERTCNQEPMRCVWPATHQHILRSAMHRACNRREGPCRARGSARGRAVAHREESRVSYRVARAERPLESRAARVHGEKLKAIFGQAGRQLGEARRVRCDARSGRIAKHVCLARRPRRVRNVPPPRSPTTSVEAVGWVRDSRPVCWHVNTRWPKRRW